MGRAARNEISVNREIRSPTIAGLLYFLAAFGTISFAENAHDVATLWPANALLLAIVLLEPRRRWPSLFLAGFIADLAADFLTHGTFVGAGFFSAANIVEISIAAFVAKRSSPGGDRSDFSRLPEFFLWCGLIAPAVSAVMGATAATLVLGEPWWKSYLTWFLSDSLGLLVCLPVFSSLISGDFARFHAANSRGQRREFLLLMIATAVVAVMALAVTRHPALFVLFIPMVWVTFRFGWTGSKMAMLIVAAVGSVATGLGAGPIVAHYGQTYASHYLQIFLAGLMATQWPLAVSLAKLKAAKESLEESERSTRLLAAEASILMLKFDLTGRCINALGATTLLDGVPQLIGARIGELSEEGQLFIRRAHDMAIDFPGERHTVEFRAFRSTGRWLEASFRATFDASGRCLGTLATIHDVTDRKVHELALARSATVDSLTGLLNRAGFMDQLEDALSRHGPGAVNLAMIDVDRFKLINDNAGHQAGDAVLIEIGNRISSQVRSTDAVARLGGDEFVILLITPDWSRATDVCERVVGAVGATPVTLPTGGTIRTGISCGVARYLSGMSREEFLHAADTALYEAKRAGRNQMKIA